MLSRGEIFIENWHKHIILDIKDDFVIAQNKKKYLRNEITIAGVEESFFKKKEFYGTFDPIETHFFMEEEVLSKAFELFEDRSVFHIWTVVENTDKTLSVLNGIRVVTPKFYLISRNPWADGSGTNKENDFIFIEGII